MVVFDCTSVLFACFLYLREKLHNRYLNLAVLALSDNSISVYKVYQLHWLIQDRSHNQVVTWYEKKHTKGKYFRRFENSLQLLVFLSIGSIITFLILADFKVFDNKCLIRGLYFFTFTSSTKGEYFNTVF